jgi:hypothetical protein
MLLKVNALALSKLDIGQLRLVESETPRPKSDTRLVLSESAHAWITTSAFAWAVSRGMV